MEHKLRSDNGTMNSKAKIALTVFLLIGAFFLVTEHRAHLTGWFPYWPYLLLLACPLMHLFMHHSHGHSHESQGARDASRDPDSERGK